jgi:hypothetical protein
VHALRAIPVLLSASETDSGGPGSWGRETPDLRGVNSVAKGWVHDVAVLPFRGVNLAAAYTSRRRSPGLVVVGDTSLHPAEPQVLKPLQERHPV